MREFFPHRLFHVFLLFPGSKSVFPATQFLSLIHIFHKPARTAENFIGRDGICCNLPDQVYAEGGIDRDHIVILADDTGIVDICLLYTSVSGTGI